MATVREGVMKKEVFSETHKGRLKNIDVDKILKPEDLLVQVLERHMENRITSYNVCYTKLLR